MTVIASQTVAGTPTPTSTETAGSTVPIVVKFKPSARGEEIDSAVSNSGGSSHRNLDQIHARVIEVPADRQQHVLDALARNSSVERAKPAVRMSMAGIPDDPGYAQQWALPKIAWDQAYGSISISGTARIALLDTGVDASHPELATRMAPGYSGIDSGDPNSDPNGHGTALAGIAAATVNNHTGMAGVAYSGVSISSVQVLGADGAGYDSDVVEGMLWAVDHGANVILMGFSSTDYSAALADALAYASSKGVVLVAATGNGGSGSVTYPSGMP
ncbi:MAG TPA: S8 family serine peptidase, partial [Chloroflexota bacterium]|nr:S8 family serine peptidase [Chloroflexota bacterium]